MKEALERTSVGTVDLSEQKQREFILILGGASMRAYYYIDGWEQSGSNMELWIRDEMNRKVVIYVCRQEGLWGVLHSQFAELVTNRELLTLDRKEAEAHKKLSDELEKISNDDALTLNVGNRKREDTPT